MLKGEIVSSHSLRAMTIKFRCYQFKKIRRNALRLLRPTGLVWIDDRIEYGELRMVALAPKSEILYYAAFVDRGEARRIISLRRANRREVKHYVENS
jgi:uncharacterized DUF497 family protein